MTCTQSAPLNKRVTFTLSTPICTPLKKYIIVLAPPICRGKMPTELHREAKKAPRDSEVHSISQKHCPKALRNQRMLCRPKASLRGRRPGLCLCLAASAARFCLSARCFYTCCFNFCPSSRCCCSSCSSCSANGGALQKLAIPVWTHPTGALGGFFPLMTQKLENSC